MPNRSTGCYLCRSRKIRCDGQRPSCRRCETHGVQCPGYKIATPGDVEFRDETQLAVQRSGGKRPAKEFQFQFIEGIATPKNGRRVALQSPSTSSSTSLSPQPPLMTFSSPAANRAQFYSNFFEIFTPKNILSHERGGAVEITNIGYLGHLGSLPNGHPALTHGMSALSLVSAGSLHRDGRLLRKAVEEYTASLSALATALQKPEAVHDDNVIMTITILKLCEFYDEINHNSNGWMDHSNGLQRILAARGPDNLTGELPAMLLANAKQVSLTHSVLARSKDYYDSPDWAQLNTEAVGYDVGTQLPALLERYDQLDLRHPSALQHIDDILTDCSQLEHGLKAYLDREIAASLHPSGKRFLEQDVETFLPFAELVTDRTLTTAYSFPSFTSAFLQTSFWIRMFFLRSTVALLESHRRRLCTSAAEPARPVICQTDKDELEGYILNLCRSIPFFIDPVNGTIGHICCFFPMVAAAKYFQEHGQTEWLGWIHHVRDHVFDKGISLPSIQGAEIPPLEV